METVLGGMILFGLFWVLVGIAAFIFWVWMLLAAIANTYEHKGVWILTLLLFNVVGAFAFYFIAYQKINAAKKGTPPL